MKEHDVIRFMKRFPNEINSRKKMTCDKWKCSTCKTKYIFELEVEVPSPCKECGGIFFETIRN